jgi:hypothetical protein
MGGIVNRSVGRQAGGALDAAVVSPTSSACSICYTMCRSRSAGLTARLFSSKAARETVDPNLHQRPSQKKIDRSRTKAPIQSSTIGMKGLAFSASCESSVAIAPPK